MSRDNDSPDGMRRDRGRVLVADMMGLGSRGDRETGGRGCDSPPLPPAGVGPGVRDSPGGTGGWGAAGTRHAVSLQGERVNLLLFGQKLGDIQRIG